MTLKIENSPSYYAVSRKLHGSMVKRTCELANLANSVYIYKVHMACT